MSQFAQEKTKAIVTLLKSDVTTSVEPEKDTSASSPNNPDETSTLDNEPRPENAYPEGGRAAWATVAGAFLIQMCGFGYTSSFGVYEDYYTRVYLTNETSSAISWIGSINAFITISAGVFFGRLYDRGYFYYLLYGGCLLISFSVFMLSLAKPNQYYQILLSQGIGVGLGAGMLYIPSIAVISQYFHSRRALAMTFVATGSSLGSMVHPLMLNNLLNDPGIGFAIGARANAGLVSGLLLIACLLMRTRLEMPNKPFNWLHAAKRFMKDGPFVFTTLGLTIFVMGYYFPIFYLQLDALKHGLDKNFAFYALVLMNGCSVIGRLSPGFFAHKLGVGNMLAASTFACAVLVLSMLALGSVASVVVIAILYGFSSGIYITLLAPFLALLTDDLSELGARMGVAFFFCGIGSLIGTPIEGALLTKNYVWWRPAVFSGIMCFLGSGCFIVAVILYARRKRRAVAHEGLGGEKA